MYYIQQRDKRIIIRFPEINSIPLSFFFRIKRKFSLSFFIFFVSIIPILYNFTYRKKKKINVNRIIISFLSLSLSVSLSLGSRHKSAYIDDIIHDIIIILLYYERKFIQYFTRLNK